jgi:hypothetical protein
LKIEVKKKIDVNFDCGVTHEPRNRQSKMESEFRFEKLSCAMEESSAIHAGVIVFADDVSR